MIGRFCPTGLFFNTSTTRLLGYFVSFSVLFLLLSQSCERTHAEQQIEAKVSIDKSRLALGERITISGFIKNVSSKKITVHKRPTAYPGGQLTFYDSNGTALKEFLLAVYELLPTTEKDFQELAPGDSLTMTFEAILGHDEIADITRQGHPRVQGLFLDFENSALLIPKDGEYRLTFYYQLGKELAAEWRKEFKLRNLWEGEVVSDPILVTISTQ